MPFGLLVWSTGLAPNPLIQSITEVEKDSKTGRFVIHLVMPYRMLVGLTLPSLLTLGQRDSLTTNDHLNVIFKDSGAADPNVFAIGDATMIKGSPLPATAQVAYQMAKYLSHKLNVIIKDKSHTTPFKFHNAGSLAYIGDWQAIYDGTKVARGPKTRGTGRIAWLLWRSAYFTRTVSIRNKYVAVPLFCKFDPDTTPLCFSRILVPLYW